MAPSGIAAAVLLALAASTEASRQFCNFSYAVEHGYSSLAVPGVDTHSTWYFNGFVYGAGSTLDRFLNETSDGVRASLRAYVNSSYGANIAGGWNTSNVFVLDIEAPVSLLPNLGLWARDDPARFAAVLAAFEMRVAVTKELFPHAKIALYGSPIGPGKHAGNYTLAIGGLVEAGRRGMFDRVDFLLPVCTSRTTRAAPTTTRLCSVRARKRLPARRPCGGRTAARCRSSSRPSSRTATVWRRTGAASSSATPPRGSSRSSRASPPSQPSCGGSTPRGTPTCPRPRRCRHGSRDATQCPPAAGTEASR